VRLALKVVNAEDSSRVLDIVFLDQHLHYEGVVVKALRY
jgi:hypothetical protein